MAAGDEEWRILAEEAAQEKDPQRLLEVINALNAAIEKQQQCQKSAPPRVSIVAPHS